MAIDRSSLTDPRQALSLIFKKENTSDVYQKNNIFHVKVLTDSFGTDDPDESLLTKVFGGSPMEQYFMGRIIGANSPHSFLPDPCIDAAKGNASSEESKNIDRLISLHTTFLMAGDAAEEKAKPGDFFEVALRGGDNGAPFNLQIGTALRKLGDGKVGETTTDCDSLEDIFDGAAVGGGYGGIAQGVGGTELFIDDVANCEKTDELILMHPLKNAGLGICSPFGPRDPIPSIPIGKHMHNGVDFAGSEGGIFSVYDGTVYRAGSHDSMGNHVFISHTFEGETFHSIYMHMLRKPMVSAGSAVKQGQQIGLIGSTGMSTAPHLHFEMHGPGSHVPQKGNWKDKWGTHSPDWKPNPKVAEYFGLSKTCEELAADPESAVVSPNKPFTEKELEEWDDLHESEQA